MKTTKKKNSLPRYVDGLGREKRNLEIRFCADCKALRKKNKIRKAQFGEKTELVVRRLRPSCDLHKGGVKRRYGSGISRRRWKQNENKKGSYKKSFKKS